MKYLEGEYPDEWHDAQGNLLTECAICNDRFQKDYMKKAPDTNEAICGWCFEEGWVVCSCDSIYEREKAPNICGRCGLDPREG